MEDHQRITILLAFVKAYETITLDDAQDVLDLLITEMTSQAKKLGQKKRLRQLKDLDRSALADVCALILDEQTSNDQLRQAIFARVSKAKLADSIATVHKLARPLDDRFYDELVEQYGRVRRFLPRLVSDIAFKAAPAGQSTLDALRYLGEV